MGGIRNPSPFPFVMFGVVTSVAETTSVGCKKQQNEGSDPYTDRVQPRCRSRTRSVYGSLPSFCCFLHPTLVVSATDVTTPNITNGKGEGFLIPPIFYQSTASSTEA